MKHSSKKPKFARIATFLAASSPSTSAVGSDSAKPNFALPVKPLHKTTHFDSFLLTYNLLYHLQFPLFFQFDLMLVRQLVPLNTGIPPATLAS